MLTTRPVRNRLICGINTTVFNMVMVVAALAVFFIVSAAAPPFHHNTVHLPAATHSVPLYRADRWDAIKISVTRDGKVFYRNELLEPSDITLRIRQSLLEGSEWKAYLEVDARVRYAIVKRVVDSILAAGVDHIAFFARDPLATPSF